MKILFFSPTFGMSGSEVALYNIICNVDRRRFKIGVAYDHPGALIKQMPSHVPTFDYSQKELTSFSYPDSGAYRIYNRILNSLYHRTHNQLYNRAPSPPRISTRERVASIHQQFQPDIWYVNTITLPLIVDLARDMNVPCVVHSHELEEVLSTLTAGSIADLKDYPTLIIANSESSARVIRTLGRREGLEVCYPPVDIKSIKSSSERSQEIKRQMGIPDCKFVWVMSGSVNPNKNVLTFLKLAQEMQQRTEDVHFIWIGWTGTGSGYEIYVTRLAEELGLGSNLTWVESKHKNYYDYLNIADAVVLTSRRESLSIVTIEAAALGKPIVSFNSEGPSEIIQDKIGVIVDSWNVSDMVNVMMKVMHGEISFCPEIARKRALTFELSSLVKKWQAILERHFPSAVDKP